MNKEFFDKHCQWADETFGVYRASAVTAHIKKELVEIEENFDIKEWADLFLLALHGVKCSGYSYEELDNAVREKHEICRNRKWGKPDENGVIEHVKELCEHSERHENDH